MTNRKAIKYAVALQRIEDVSRKEMWGQGQPIEYLSELSDDFDFYARQRSNFKYGGFSGCINIINSAIFGGLTAATTAAVFLGNGEDTSLLLKTIYKASGALGGLIGGGLLAGTLQGLEISLYQKEVSKIANEREKRRVERNNNRISNAQVRSGLRGLILSESNRYDVMTGGRHKLSKEDEATLVDKVESLFG